MAWRTCQTQRTATGRIAGPDSPPVTPARCGRIVSVLITMPSRVLITDTPVGAGAHHGAGDRDDVGDVRRQLGEASASRGSLCRLTAWITSAADTGLAGEHLAAVLDVGAGDVDLDRRDPLARCAAARRASRTRRRCRRRSRRSCAPRARAATRGPCSMNASMPGPCSPMELSIPLGVSAMRGVGRPERGCSMIALGDDGADRGDVEELVELAAGGRAARRRQDRVGQLDAAEDGGHVDVVPAALVARERAVGDQCTRHQ